MKEVNEKELEEILKPFLGTELYKVPADTVIYLSHADDYDYYKNLISSINNQLKNENKEDYTLLISKTMYVNYNKELINLGIPYIIYNDNRINGYCQLYNVANVSDTKVLYIDSNMILLHEKRD